MPAPPARALALRALSPLARVAMHGPVLRAVERRIDRTHRAPRNEEARAEIRMVAEGPAKRVLLSMGDPYRVTAELLAEGLVRLVGGAKAAGVVAPAEALPAAETLTALSRRVPEFQLSVDESKI
jgi:hypothetical protein